MDNLLQLCNPDRLNVRCELHEAHILEMPIRLLEKLEGQRVFRGIIHTQCSRNGSCRGSEENESKKRLE